MHNKNNNKTQTFIQGLRPFSSSIPKTLKKFLKKGGYNYSNIVDNWTKMVSKKISDACYPVTIKMGKEMKDGTLILNVTHGKELEVEYQKNVIMDQINSFFSDNINEVNIEGTNNEYFKNKLIDESLTTEENKALFTLKLKLPLTMEKIKKNYKKLVKIFHPDVNGNNKKAEEKFKKITESYKLLLKKFIKKTGNKT